MKNTLYSIQFIFLTNISLWGLTTAGLLSVFQIERQSSNNNDTLHFVDCLYYYVLDNIVNYYPRNSQWHQGEIIPYCMGDENLSTTEIPTSNKRESDTFDQLRQQNVTTEQLFSWSTSIDLVEDYEIYLNNITVTNASETTFYNCSIGWFGRMCQYTFTKRLSLVQYTFLDMVTQIFDIKWKGTTDDLVKKHPDQHTLYSCYTLIKCDQNSLTVCLDWREVCDGKVDCLNDGQDELFCTELEMNECAENEYRCHNGAQCIPEELFHDDIHNPDCVDGTDEPKALLDTVCIADPSFRCEEQFCQHSFLFSCGDGQCIEKPFLFSNVVVYEESNCLNARDRFIHYTVLSRKANPIIEYNCWKVMFCYFRDHNMDDGLEDCIGNPCGTSKLTKNCVKTIMYNCQSTPQFVFPQSSVAFLGEVDIVYDINILLNNTDEYMIPAYICFRNQRCKEFFTHSVEVANKSMCQSISQDFGNINHIYMQERSCSLNQNNRFRCLPKSIWDKDPICISPILIQNDFDDCLNGDDELGLIEKNQTKIPPFALLCDSFVDIEEIDNETDETNCEEWSCDNGYTRCDGIWHCLNGAEEANCKNSVCPSYTHPCLLSTNNTMICLPLSKTNDNNTDCRGASDERLFCRHMYPSQPRYRYKCWNESKCIDTSRLCDAEPDGVYDLDFFIDCQVYGDDERFCRPHDVYSICESDYPDRRTVEEQVLCDLAEIYSRGGRRIYGAKPHFSLAYAGYYPVDLLNVTGSTIDAEKNSTVEVIQPNKLPLPKVDFETAWFCNRGIYIMLSTKRNSTCLCPPSYYGPRCEYQNQRVSLTLQFRTDDSPIIWRTTIFHFFVMLIDEEYTINSYEQIIYLPMRDCNTKFQIHLLYQDRPKNLSKNYSIQIDSFIKNDLSYYASWQLSIPFLFLPVNRLASIISIPTSKQREYNYIENVCGKHGRSIRYVSSTNFFCQCDTSWKGRWCNIKRKNNDQCKCSSHSLCIEPGLCLCPLNKFGSRCYLTQSSCKSNTCSNRGLCVSNDQRISEYNFTCICKEGYWGNRCEHISTQIDIHFINIPIPQGIHLHLIKSYENNTAAHERMTTFKKILIDQDFATFQISSLFNILFVELDKKYYLAVVQEKRILRNYISTQINPSRQCLSIENLLNSIQLTFSILRRVKYYHLICRMHQNLPCFYDNIYMCLCNNERQVNCLSFDHNMTYNCHGRIYCKNDAQCYQDHPTCPTKSLCICPECFYGSRCQFSTQGYSLSLDTILAYQIRPNVSFARQRLIIKVALIFTLIIFCSGLINGLLSTITFQINQLRQVGCGIYLLTSSLVSFLPIIIISLKFTFLVLAQTKQIINQKYLFINCILIDFLLQVTLNMGNWLNACVAVERGVNIYQGINFNKIKSRQIAKPIIVFLTLITTLTALHDPFHRRLIDDEDPDDRRVLCTVIYSSLIKKFDLTMNMIHFIVPFFLNIISALIVIISVARKRSTAQRQFTYRQHLRKQFDENKHLLISPIIVIILALPRLIISFISGCMKSIRDPWLFLIGYFISFLPSISVFIIFVLPSKMYQKQFRHRIRQFSSTNNSHLRKK